MTLTQEARKPLPKPGQTIRTSIPFYHKESVAYLIERMKKYISEGSRQSIVRAVADECRVSMEKKPGIDTLKAIHVWGADRFTYMDDPVSQQVIETPMRMIRRINAIEEATHTAMLPFLKGDPRKKIAVPGKIGGTSACSTILLLSIVRAAGFRDLMLRLGGHDGVLHYAWGQVKVGAQWLEVDFLNREFGKLLPFDCYETTALPRK